MAIQDHHAAPPALGFGLGGAVARLGRWLMGGVHVIQCARMSQALAEMNDHQLAKIGITRAEIPTYAASLVNGDR